jgi:hypothetical protein
MTVTTLRALPDSEDDQVRCYSVARLAKLLDVGRTWLYAEINAGRLKTTELGSTRAKTRIRHPDAVAFLEARSTG